MLRELSNQMSVGIISFGIVRRFLRSSGAFSRPMRTRVTMS